MKILSYLFLFFGKDLKLYKIYCQGLLGIGNGYKKPGVLSLNLEFC